MLLRFRKLEPRLEMFLLSSLPPLSHASSVHQNGQLALHDFRQLSRGTIHSLIVTNRTTDTDYVQIVLSGIGSGEKNGDYAPRILAFDMRNYIIVCGCAVPGRPNRDDNI